VHSRHAVLTALLSSLLAAAPLAAQNFNYGAAIAAGRTDVLIGQPENTYSPGFVYVYRAGPKGDWKLVTKLTAEGATNNDGFGKTIALDGNTALIGSIAADSERGAVFAFAREPSGAWHQTARIVAPDAAPGEHFGRHLALSGDAAFITSSRNKGVGAVYIFHRDGMNHWSADTVLTPSDSEPANWYGAGVASEGSRLYVSAAALGGPPADSGSGAVYVYTRDKMAGTWKQETRLVPGPGSVRSGFGAALLPQGDSLWIGAPGYDRQVGAVFLFARDSTGKWSPSMHLLPFDGSPRSLFGVTLAQVGTELWVGSPGSSRFEGRVYRFTRDTAGWTAASRTGIPGLDGQALFGFTMAANGNVAVVGTPGQDFQEGGAALFTRGPAGWKLATRTVGDVTSLPGLTGAKRECTGGKVSIFDCQQVDLMAFLPVKDIGGKRGIELNDIWGYTDPVTHHEYALVGRLDGTSFVDITDASHPVYLGDLPKTAKAPTSIWRDIKTYQHYAFVVADGAREHGMQVFDLDRLRHPGKTPATFTEDAHYDRIHSAHNIVVDTATGYAYLVGGSAGGEMCGGGLHMVDIRSPLHPQFAGCFADSTTGRSGTGYTHDAQCVIYHGPDAKFSGREICFDFAETALGIADVTDKASPKALSHQSYPNVGYAHQGWLTDDQKYVYADDELDEMEGLVPGTRTLIWDVSDLENPVLAGEYVSPNHAIDHNLFVVGNTVYESNYLSGLRVLDITDRLHPKPAGFFDTVPVGPDAPQFGGSWGNYPFFPSGLVAVTSMKEGLFVLRAHPVGATP
jgi:choice-of-anchor B domain-containing protein